MSTAPFNDSRRLTGCNLYFDKPGAVLDSEAAAAEGVAKAWRTRVAQGRGALGWPDGPIAVRAHAQGLSLAFAAPLDQLYTATEVNEWALCAALQDCGIEVAPSWDDMPECLAAPDDTEALAILAASARAERVPELQSLALAAAQHGINALVDEEQVTLGSGRGGRTWPLTDLPHASAIDWSVLSDVPIALVTGSNGKTTIARLLAAFGWAHGWRTAHSCTDGVFVGRDAIDRDDYSGPAGARLALRRHDIDAAILETARGGLMRRGIAPTRVDVAVVTNISNDHFGEYGIDDLDGLAEAKLNVARPLGTRGTLVTNADDPVLMRHLDGIRAPLALFAFDADSPVLSAHRDSGAATAGVRDGRLVLQRNGRSLDLGAVDAMPLTFDGAARYNIANIAAAVLAADVLGIAAETLRNVLASFGARHEDNPGRLEHHVLGEIEVFVDFAHNPDGLRGLLDAATRTRTGRVGLTLGQAGDRGEREISELAEVAAEFTPDCVVLKDQPAYLRGRDIGEVPAILREALRKAGLDATRIVSGGDEWDALLWLLAWARPGDTLVLQILDKANRQRISNLLEQLTRNDWRAGNPLPATPD